MALQLERNVNLEEIDADALFGIEYLSHQSFFQKILLGGCMIGAVVSFVGTQLFLQTPFIVSFFLSLLLGGVGVMFGANQSEYLSIAQYLKLIFFKPTKYVRFESTEDVLNMKKEAEKIKIEEANRRKIEATATPEEQRKMLVRIIVFIISILLFTFGAISIKTYKNSQIKHHVITGYTEITYDYEGSLNNG